MYYSNLIYSVGNDTGASANDTSYGISFSTAGATGDFCITNCHVYPRQEQQQRWIYIGESERQQPRAQPTLEPKRFRVKTEAEQKAERLFRKVLGDEMYKKLIRRKHLVVIGNDKKRYLIRKGEMFRISCEDGISYGNHSDTHGLPYFDEALARILALKTHAEQIRENSCRQSAGREDLELLRQALIVY